MKLTVKRSLVLGIDREINNTTALTTQFSFWGSKDPSYDFFENLNSLYDSNSGICGHGLELGHDLGLGHGQEVLSVSQNKTGSESKTGTGTATKKVYKNVILPHGLVLP